MEPTPRLSRPTPVRRTEVSTKQGGSYADGSADGPEPATIDAVGAAGDPHPQLRGAGGGVRAAAGSEPPRPSVRHRSVLARRHHGARTVGGRLRRPRVPAPPAAHGA